MTNAEISRLSAPVVQAYRDCEDEILQLIGKQLGKYKRLGDTSKWRIRQLARAGEINRKAIDIINSYAGGIDTEAYEAIIAAAEGEVGVLDEAMLNLLSESGAMTDDVRKMLESFERQSVQELNVKNAEIAGGYAKALTERFNLVNTVMGYQATSSFIQAVNSIYNDREKVVGELNAGAMAVVSGTESLNEATRRTIHRLAQKGIPGFVDKAGREWSPEAYVKMDLRSTLGNTARAAQDARCDAYGISLIAVSSHMGARPKCAPYQGRIFSRDGSRGSTKDGAGNDIEYIPLSETSYGEPDGLFGINCGHQQYPFIPGVNIQRYYPYDEEQNAKVYEQTQKQRAMERKIRADKRECMMLQETGDEEGLKKASQRLRADKDKYVAFSRQTGLGVHNENTQVYGYDRSKSMKTVWAGRENQAFKSRLSSEAVTVTRKGTEINAHAVEGTVNRFYISDKSILHKPKELHDVDRTLTETFKALNIQGEKNLPTAFVVASDELPLNVIGSYNPVKNQLFLREELFNGADISEIQKDGVFPGNKLSTTIHEMIHWQDAEQFRRSGGVFSSPDVYNKYCNDLDRKAKKALDRVGVSDYNVNKISRYADRTYRKQEYNEVYTELRTRSVLERMK